MVGLSSIPSLPLRFSLFIFPSILAVKLPITSPSPVIDFSQSSNLSAVITFTPILSSGKGDLSARDTSGGLFSKANLWSGTKNETAPDLRGNFSAASPVLKILASAPEDPYFTSSSEGGSAQSYAFVETLLEEARHTRHTSATIGAVRADDTHTSVMTHETESLLDQFSVKLHNRPPGHGGMPLLNKMVRNHAGVAM